MNANRKQTTNVRLAHTAYSASARIRALSELRKRWQGRTRNILDASARAHMAHPMRFLFAAWYTHHTRCISNVIIKISVDIYIKKNRNITSESDRGGARRRGGAGRGPKDRVLPDRFAQETTVPRKLLCLFINRFDARHVR